MEPENQRQWQIVPYKASKCVVNYERIRSTHRSLWIMEAFKEFIRIHLELGQNKIVRHKSQEVGEEKDD